jgi:hypothetical protein
VVVCSCPLFVVVMEHGQWVKALRNAGFPGPEERVTVVANFLKANKLKSVRRMRLAGDPEAWPGSCLLAAGELDFLVGWATRCGPGGTARSRSRGGAAEQSVVMNVDLMKVGVGFCRLPLLRDCCLCG